MQNIKLGQTLVSVNLPNTRTHHGVVVQETTHFLRVYCPDKPDRDVSQLSSELFAKEFCTYVGELEKPIRLEPQLR